MKRVILTALLAVVVAGCGNDNKAVPPAGPMTPPGAGAEREGGAGKGTSANSASEK